MKAKFLKIVLPAVLAVGFNATTTQLHASFIPLGQTNYLQNFDTLPSSGKAKVTIPGWAIAEFGNEDNMIQSDNGSMSLGGAYSYGRIGSNNRAMGTLNDGMGNYSYFGADFQNTGHRSINSLNVSFTGEEWRLGRAGVQNTLAFQYSLNAGSLTSGTWINVPSLSFTTPNTVGVGAHDGTLASNERQIASTISFLNIPVGSTFWIRWLENTPGGKNAPGDGLAIDNFSISAVPEATTLFGSIVAVVLCALALRGQGRSSKAVLPA